MKLLNASEAIKQMKNGKIIYPDFFGIEARYYKIENDTVLYSDDLIKWKKSRIKNKDQFIKASNCNYKILK